MSFRVYRNMRVATRALRARDCIRELVPINGCHLLRSILRRSSGNATDMTDLEQADLDAREADRIFRLLMGDNVEDRRRFIEDNAANVKNLDI